MINYLNYVTVYLVGGFLGYLWERLLGAPSTESLSYSCGDTLNKLLKLCIPFLHIYGLGAMVLLFIQDRFSQTNKFLLAISSAIVLTILECILGQLSKYINGYSKWNYKDKYNLSFCNGFVAFQPFLLWFFISFFFFYFF